MVFSSFKNVVAGLFTPFVFQTRVAHLIEILVFSCFTFESILRLLRHRQVREASPRFPSCVILLICGCILILSLSFWLGVFLKSLDPSMHLHCGMQPIFAQIFSSGCFCSHRTSFHCESTGIIFPIFFCRQPSFPVFFSPAIHHPQFSDPFIMRAQKPNYYPNVAPPLNICPICVIAQPNPMLTLPSTVSTPEKNPVFLSRPNGSKPILARQPTKNPPGSPPPSRESFDALLQWIIAAR